MVAAVSHNMKPFITRVNNPNVSILKGRVTSSSKGRIKALITPRNNDPTIAAHKVSRKPGNSAAVSMIARMLIAHLKAHP
jgi:hypothetical protein